MSLNNLEDLFLHELKDTYDAEKRMTKALPKMARSASSKSLKAAFERHLKVTQNQIERLERIFKLLKKPVRGKKCMGMMGLVDEGSELMQEDGSEAAIDAGLIGAAQKAEHYEIAVYGTMATYAELLGLEEAERLLKQTLAEEKRTDVELSQLARKINFEAEQDTSEQDGRSAKGKRKKGKARGGNLFGRMGKSLAGLVGNE
jgi:ferritin-like metal-binding protein YciE